jgi:hypothetical protein
MKNIVIIVVAVLMGMVPAGGAWAAEETPTAVVFNMQDGFFQEICKKQVWKGTEAVWGGVTDGRESPFIGTQVKKGDEAINVSSDPALAKVMNDALKDLFEECGLALVDKKTPGALTLSAQIVTFDVSVIKNLVSSKSSAESLLRFTVEKGTKSSMIDVGVEMDSKGVRRGSFKALANAANKLLLETLREIPKNDHMKTLGKL